MSKRGSLNGETLKTGSTHSWVTRWIICLTLVFTLLPTLTLIAQDAPPPKTVTIHVDGTTRQVTTVKETVQTLLHQEQIVLVQHDRCEPTLTAPVTHGMTLTITRVRMEIIREQLSVPQPTITRWHRAMTDKPVVVSEGKPGVAVQTRVIWRKDGVIAEQWTQNKRVIVAPKPKIVLRSALKSRDGLARSLTVVSTAYTPHDAGCSGITAMGIPARRGVIAVDPRVIPLGTRVYVDGYGVAIAADTGGAIKGNRIDVCYPTRREAFAWGRRTVRITLLD